jgi:multidrug efflux pump subunit AcrA (membrane-fusion protein)
MKTRAVLGVLGLAAVAAGVFFGVRAVMAPVPEPGDEAYEEPEPPAADLPPGTRFEKVRSVARDSYETFPGRISATNLVPVRVPAGMRVSVVEILKDSGDAVKQGEVLLRFHKPQIEKAIEEAEKAGRAEDAQRFRGYLAFVDLKSPIDGYVHEVKTELGRVPVDEGDTALVTLVDPKSYALEVQVPSAITSTVAHLSARLTAVLEGTNGTVTGTVAAYKPAPDGWTTLVIGLDPREGLEPDMAALLRVPTSKTEAALVPKSAVDQRPSGVKVVRVWEASDRMVAERTILTDGEVGDDYVVTAGVLPDESVVVPDRSRER